MLNANTNTNGNSSTDSKLADKIQGISNSLAGVTAILKMFAHNVNDPETSEALHFMCKQTQCFSLELGDIAADVGILCILGHHPHSPVLQDR